MIFCPSFSRIPTQISFIRAQWFTLSKRRFLYIIHFDHVKHVSWLYINLPKKIHKTQHIQDIWAIYYNIIPTIELFGLFGEIALQSKPFKVLQSLFWFPQTYPTIHNRKQKKNTNLSSSTKKLLCAVWMAFSKGSNSWSSIALSWGSRGFWPVEAPFFSEFVAEISPEKSCGVFFLVGVVLSHPFEKICSSNGIMSPRLGMNIKKIVEITTQFWQRNQSFGTYSLWKIPFSSQPFKLEWVLRGKKNTFSAPVSGYVPGPSLLQLGLSKVYWGNIYIYNMFSNEGNAPCREYDHGISIKHLQRFWSSSLIHTYPVIHQGCQGTFGMLSEWTLKPHFFSNKKKSPPQPIGFAWFLWDQCR